MRLFCLKFTLAPLYRSSSLSVPIIRYYASASTTPLPIPPALAELCSSDDLKLARDWVDSFRKLSLPRNVVELTFARSSGPGGQNVNKVNTKAMARCLLTSPWIPLWAKPVLQNSPYYVSSSHALLISSSLHRSQAQNVDDCLSKLHSLILDSASSSIRNETSPIQRERVKGLQLIEKTKKRKDKTYRSQAKKDRSYRD